MTRRFNWLIVVLIVLIGVPYYWLLLDNRPGDARPKPVTIAQLRSLAASMPGQAPSEVRLEQVAWRRLPGNLFAAGSGLKRRRIAIMAWQLPVPGRKPVMIDSGVTKALSDEMQLETFLPEVQARVDAALAGAGLVLITHEHPDHLGPLAAMGGAPLRQAARLNADQLPSAPLASTLPWRERDGLSARIAPGAPQAVAPGVVVIPAPSHTPGSQMIFVRLANGREYLFAGDIATMDASWRELRARSRLVGDMLAPEERGEVYAWLLTIRALKAQAPHLVVVPGHDFEEIASPLANNGIVRGFVDAQPQL
jgi:glyoxylase-like metal-dependent hydrolase (beta-lactamase superfamily II)